MQTSKRHHELDERGIGKCSVPMWMGGVPAGFCDEPAYGNPIREIVTGWTPPIGGIRRPIPLYVPGLACPAHGGPTIRTYKDGNKWCAVYLNHIDLQTSPAGFGDTPEEAHENLTINARNMRDGVK